MVVSYLWRFGIYFTNKKIKRFARITHELHTKNEMEDKHIDWFIATICRGFARYDANEVLQQDTDTRTTDNKGYNADYAD